MEEAVAEEAYIAGTKTLFVMRYESDEVPLRLLHVDEVLKLDKGKKELLKCRPIIGGKMVKDKLVVAKIWVKGGYMDDTDR